MDSLNVFCVDDEREILTGLRYDLSEFEDCIQIELFDTAEDLLDEVKELSDRGESLALIITDQMMPGLKGAELLEKVGEYGDVTNTKAIMLTGQATHEDTIHAINSGKLNLYISKPWEKKVLVKSVRDLLTSYVIDAHIDSKPYMKYLDVEKLLKNSNLGISAQ